MAPTLSASLRRLLPSLAIALVVTAFLWSNLFAQEGLLYQEYNVGITLNEDGSFRVRSEQVVRFDDEYNTAFLEIPIDHVTEISDIAVYDEAPRFTAGGGLRPLSFSTTEDGDSLYIDWEYDTTVRGEVRTFVVEYTVNGGMWVYDDNDVLQWFAINADRSGLPILAAEVTLTVPEVLTYLDERTVTAAVVSGNGFAILDGDTVVYTPNGPLADGEAFEIDLQFPHGVLPIAMQPWQREQAEADAVASIPQIDVALAIQPDGLIDVTEDVHVAVSQGALYSGYRTINTLYQDEIRNVRVYQDGQPLPRGVEGCVNCYTATFTPSTRSWARFNPQTGEVEINDDAVGQMEIRWWTPAIEAGETSEISVRYTVVGGIRTGSNQVINFEVLPDYDLAIEAATLQIAPPPGVGADRISVESTTAQSEPQVTDSGAILLRDEELPATRARWQVVITMPGNATNATTPEWQQQFESAVTAGNAYMQAQARRTLFLRIAAALAVFAAIGAAAWAWVRYGRRRANEMLKGYVAEPPSDLAPGIVAYLMDRKASERGVLASLFHLAAAGLIDVDLSSGIQIRRKQQEPIVANRRIRTAQGADLPIEDHQAAIFNDVLVPNAPLNQFVPLDALATPLRSALPDIFSKMGKDAQEFFVSASSSGGGGSWRFLSRMLPVVFMLVAFYYFVFSRGDSATSTMFLIAFFAFAVFLVVFAMRRPFGGSRRSATGEVEAEKWTRFRNYLLNLKEYGDLGAAQELLDRHFAYAVALGAESVVLAQAESMGAHLPPWTPIPTHYPYDFPSSGGNNSGGTGANWPRPDLEPRPMGQAMPAPVVANAPQQSSPAPSLTGMSAAMGESLSSGSRSLGQSLTTAAGGAAATTVVFNSALKQRTMQFDAQTTPSQMLDGIMRQSLNDARVITSRPSPGSMMRSTGGGGSSGGSIWGGSSSGSSRSSGGFGGSSSSSSSRSSWSSSSSSSSSRSSSSSSSSSRSSSSSGRSGFGKR